MSHHHATVRAGFFILFFSSRFLGQDDQALIGGLIDSIECT